jgi:acetyl esterase/lipase
MEDGVVALLSGQAEVRCGRLVLPCRFKATSGASYLSVQFHGAVLQGKAPRLPVFARWNWGRILGAHVLSICDPTLYLDESLTAGWYLGTRDESAIDAVLDVAQRCAAKLGIPAARIVYMGNSAGGFAALQAAARSEHGRGIAINPQTDLSAYRGSGVTRYVRQVSRCGSMEEAERVFADRWSAISALTRAVARGAAPRVVYVQNRNDPHHQEHFRPFAEALGLDANRESSRAGMMSILYDGPEGHENAETPEVFKRVLAEGLPFLLRGLTTIVSRSSGRLVARVVAAVDQQQYACYLLRDGVVCEKHMYQRSGEFSFGIPGPGSYTCRGFARDPRRRVRSAFSGTVLVAESEVGR